jgi:hypothetical protein
MAMEKTGTVGSIVAPMTVSTKPAITTAVNGQLVRQQ